MTAGAPPPTPPPGTCLPPPGRGGRHEPAGCGQHAAGRGVGADAAGGPSSGDQGLCIPTLAGQRGCSGLCLAWESARPDVFDVMQSGPLAPRGRWLVVHLSSAGRRSHTSICPAPLHPTRPAGCRGARPGAGDGPPGRCDERGSAADARERPQAAAGGAGAVTRRPLRRGRRRWWQGCRAAALLRMHLVNAGAFVTLAVVGCTGRLHAVLEPQPRQGMRRCLGAGVQVWVGLHCARLWAGVHRLDRRARGGKVHVRPLDRAGSFGLSISGAVLSGGIAAVGRRAALGNGKS